MRRNLALTLLLLLCAARAGRAQVMVAPTALFLGDRAPTGTLLVANQSGEAQEVSLDFRFGYPVSDSAGNLSMAYGDSLPAAPRSAAGWIRAFPRRFVLRPGMEQTVRVVARPPAGLPEGTYWTRVVTAAVPQAAAATGEGAQLRVRLEQVTTLLFRHGRASAAVDVGTASLDADQGGAVHLRVPLVRRGNSPFFGTVAAEVVDARGERVARAVQVLAVYTELTARLAVPRLAPGEYTVNLEVTAERGDVPRADQLAMEPIRRSQRVTVP